MDFESIKQESEIGGVLYLWIKGIYGIEKKEEVK